MAEKMAIPMELIYQMSIGSWTDLQKGFLYAISEKYGAEATIDIYEMVCNMDDRVKNMTNAILIMFFLKGNDAETIGEVLDLWDEITGIESTILERSKTINRRKVIKCPFKTKPQDVSDWNLPFINILTKTINPKVTFERPKAMCAGDSYCEYVWKLEERDVAPVAKKLETPCAAPKRGISWEQKANFTGGNGIDFFKGFIYAIREKYGAAATLEIIERVWKMDDRAKTLTNTVRTIFKIEGNDAEAIGKWFEIFGGLAGYEFTTLERSKTITRMKYTKCIHELKYLDIADFGLILDNIVAKTINPKATVERPKAMCAGDPYCEYVYKIEE
jgi:hypothetical protein